MLIVDTNVLSEIMRANPDPAVLAWFDRQDPALIWTSAITVFEVRFGIARLPAGARRDWLAMTFETILGVDLGGRVAAIDRAAAEAASALAARMEARGRSGEVRDLMIGGVALARGASVVTRNARHFDDPALRVIDPWAD